MIIVKVYFNTDANHELVPADVPFEDLPQCWFGPFDDLTDAISFMENDYPEDDTDVYDMIADDFDVPDEAVLNDPVEFRKQFEQD